jgi:uncharacterized protein YraI
MAPKAIIRLRQKHLQYQLGEVQTVPYKLSNAVFVSLALAALVALSFPAFAAENATITGDNVRVRSFPSVSPSFAKVLGELARGARVEVRSETDFLDTVDGYTGPWYSIAYGGESGFVFGRYVKIDRSATVYIYPENRTSELILRYIRDNLASFGTSQSYIVKRLGQPIKSLEREDIEAGAPATNHTLVYDGISFDVFGRSGEDMPPFSLTCTTDAYDFGGLKVGSPVADVKRVLGEPNSVDGNWIEYFATGSAAFGASFKIQNGKVVEIRLSALPYD